MLLLLKSAGIKDSSIDWATISIFDPNIPHNPTLTPYLTCIWLQFCLAWYGKYLQCTKHVLKFSNTKHLFHRQRRDIRCSTWLVFVSSFTKWKDDSYLSGSGPFKTSTLQLWGSTMAVMPSIYVLQFRFVCSQATTTLAEGSRSCLQTQDDPETTHWRFIVKPNFVVIFIHSLFQY